MPMPQKSQWPPYSIRMDPEAVRRARVAALMARKNLGEWLEEAIDEKLDREQADGKEPKETG